MTLSDVLRSRLETVGAEAGALVHWETGACLEAIQGGCNKAETTVQEKESAVSIDIDTVEQDAVATAQFVRLFARQAEEQGDEIEEFVSTAPEKYEISQFLRTSTGSELLLYMRFDTSHMSPALARHRLSGFERQIELSSEDTERLRLLTLTVATPATPPTPAIEAEPVAEAKAPIETVIARTVPAEVPAPESPPIPAILATIQAMEAPPVPIVEPVPVPVEIPAAPLSPAAHALRQRESLIKEEEEYRQMNADSIRWLKEMKKLLSWTRPPVRSEPIKE